MGLLRTNSYPFSLAPIRGSWHCHYWHLDVFLATTLGIKYKVYWPRIVFSHNVGAKVQSVLVSYRL